MNENTERKNSRKILLVITVILCVLVVIIVGFKANMNKHNIQRAKTKEDNTLLGLWTTDGITFYEFKENGNGVLKLPLSEYLFTYKIEENKLFIDFESKETRDANYEYFFEKENLILKGIKGTTGNYTFYKQ